MAKDLQYTLSLKDLFSKQMRGAVDSTKQMDAKVSSLSSGFGKLGGAISGAFAIGQVVNFGKAVFASLDNYQQFSVALRTMMTGDVFASKALEGQLIELAKTTPFELTEVQDATRKLMAYGVSGGKVVETIKTLGDVSAGLGKESLPFIIRAFGQIKSKGHLAGQELNQLTEQGFNPLNIISKKTGESYDTLLKRMEKGKITFSEVEQSFKDVTKEGGQFFNMMDEQSRTVGGRWSNIADTWEQIKVNIGKSQTGILASTMEMISGTANLFNKKLETGNFLDEILGKNKLETGFFDKYLGMGSYSGLEKKAEDMQLLIKWAEDATTAKLSILKVTNAINKLKEDSKKGWVDKDEYLKGMALYTETYKLITGKMKLKTAKPNDTMLPVGETDGKLSSLGKSATSSGVNISAQRPQSLVINITELVHELKIQANDLKDSTIKIKEEVTKIFLEMVNEANLAAR